MSALTINPTDIYQGLGLNASARVNPPAKKEACMAINETTRVRFIHLRLLPSALFALAVRNSPRSDRNTLRFPSHSGHLYPLS